MSLKFKELKQYKLENMQFKTIFTKLCLIDFNW